MDAEPEEFRGRYWTGVGDAGWKLAVEPPPHFRVASVGISGQHRPDSRSLREMLSHYAPTKPGHDQGGDTCAVSILHKRTASDAAGDEHAQITDEWERDHACQMAKQSHGQDPCGHLDVRLRDQRMVAHGVSLQIDSESTQFCWVHGKLVVTIFEPRSKGSPARKRHRPNHADSFANNRLRVSVFTVGPAECLTSLQYTVWSSMDFDVCSRDECVDPFRQPSDFQKVLLDYWDALMGRAEIPASDAVTHGIREVIARAECGTADTAGYRLVSSVVGKWPAASESGVDYGLRRLSRLQHEWCAQQQPDRTDGADRRPVAASRRTLVIAVHSIAQGASHDWLAEFMRAWGAGRAVVVWPSVDSIFGSEKAPIISGFYWHSSNYTLPSRYTNDYFTAGNQPTQKDQRHGVLSDEAVRLCHYAPDPVRMEHSDHRIGHAVVGAARRPGHVQQYVLLESESPEAAASLFTERHDGGGTRCVGFLSTSANLSSFAWGEPRSISHIRNFEIGIMALPPALRAHGFEDFSQKLPTPFECMRLRAYEPWDQPWDTDAAGWYKQINAPRMAALASGLRRMLERCPATGRPLHRRADGTLPAVALPPDLNSAELAHLHKACGEINASAGPRRHPGLHLTHVTEPAENLGGYGCRLVVTCVEMAACGAGGGGGLLDPGSDEDRAAF
jgi:hypothetical protein